MSEPAGESTATGGPDERELERVDDVPSRPRVARGPVGWLLTPEMLAQARAMAHRRRGDPRDWMPVRPGHAHVEDGAPDAGRTRDVRVEALGGGVDPGVVEPVAEEEPRFVEPPGGELWFDYVADTGDGEAAMYSVAYLLQTDLQVVPAGDPRAGDRDRRDGADVIVAGAGDADEVRLPRGQFLVLGGDIAYHVADRATIDGRIRAPFTWAARDLVAAGAHLWPRRRLYGIPGNHDWYDDLGGFGDLVRAGGSRDTTGGPLDLAGFERVQAGSYVAIELPWDWQLWALDAEHGLDRRQETYFRSLPRSARQVLVCHTPPVVFGSVELPGPYRDALERLHLPAYFDDGAEPPPAGHCRLDIGGDHHHYARYEEPGAPADPTGAPARYRSVVAGLGGAFLHPTLTMHGSRPPSALHPGAAESRRAVGARVFNPLWLFRGGLIRVLPLLFCLCLAGAALSDTGTGWLADRALAAFGIDREAGVWSSAAVTIRERGGAHLLDDALGFLGCLVLAVALIIAALWWGGRVNRAHLLQPERRRSLIELRGLRDLFDPMRSYWLAWLLGTAGAALPFVSPMWFDFADASAIWFDVLVYLLAAFALVGGTAMGVIGARGLPRSRQVALAALGLCHGVAQLVAPFVIARIALAEWWIVPAMIAITAAGLLVGLALFVRARRLHPLLMFALGVAALGAALAVAVIGGHGVAVDPRGDVEWVVVHLGAPLLAMFFGCAVFGWYLAIAGSAGGHNNELGVAALVERYRAFVRFRLTRDRLTGFVIGLDQVSTDPGALRPRVIDRFDIAPRDP